MTPGLVEAVPRATDLQQADRYSCGQGSDFFDAHIRASPHVWTLRRFLAAQQLIIVFPASELHIVAGVMSKMRQPAYLKTLPDRPAVFSNLRQADATCTM